MKRALLVLLALAACRTPPRPLPTPAGPYGDAFSKWSRQAAVYKGFDTVAFVAATYHAPSFSAALSEEVVRVYGTPDAITDGARLVWARAVRPGEVAGPEFLVALIAADRGMDQLDGQAPAWRLWLQDGSGTREPATIQRLDLDMPTRALYPFLGPFSTAYRVRFAGPAPSGDVALHIAGADGRAELRWP